MQIKNVYNSKKCLQLVILNLFLDSEVRNELVVNGKKKKENHCITSILL